MQRGLSYYNAFEVFAHLNIQGLHKYTDRGLCVPSRTVVVANEDHGDLNPVLEYYKKVGVGAEKVTTYDPETYDLAKILFAQKHLVSNTTPLEFFCITEEQQYAAIEAGIPKEHIFHAKPDLGKNMNNKGWLRQLMEFLNLRNALLPYRICRNLQEVQNAFRVLPNHGHPLIIKAMDDASGMNMIISSDRKQITRTFQTYNSQWHKPMIIESYVKGKFDLSCQWEIYENGPVFHGVTTQIIEHDTVHKGNLIVKNNPLPGVSAQDTGKIFQMTRKIVQYLFEEGARGWVSFDLIKDPASGNIYVLELNGRPSAPMYASLAMRKIEKMMGTKWAVVLMMIQPKEDVQNFQDLEKLLGKNLFDGKSGILPFVVRTLPEKVGLLAIARYTHEATTLAQKASELLHE